MEDDMSEIEMTNEVETEEFTDELSDEALDREQDGGGKRSCEFCLSATGRRGQDVLLAVVPVTDR